LEMLAQYNLAAKTNLGLVRRSFANRHIVKAMFGWASAAAVVIR
jgi:hypothetical protein